MTKFFIFDAMAIESMQWPSGMQALRDGERVKLYVAFADGEPSKLSVYRERQEASEPAVLSVAFDEDWIWKNLFVEQGWDQEVKSKERG